MTPLPPTAARLLADAPEEMPLDRREFRPHPNAPELVKLDPAVLFPDATSPAGALAGVLLRLGCWTASHDVAQDVNSAEGSFWHGIIHRIEPDSFNAGYWFKRTGRHPVYAELHKRAAEILTETGNPAGWRLKSTWDPHLFIEWCEEARERRGQAEPVAKAIQLAEWQLLFEFCARSR